MPPMSEDDKRKQEEAMLANADLPEEERRRIKRRASNRESARRTRQKRTEKLKEHEDRIAYLRAENAKITQQIHELEKLYFDAVLQNRSLKGDIQVIRTAKPHLNALCPPAVTNSTNHLASQPFLSDMFPQARMQPGMSALMQQPQDSATHANMLAGMPHSVSGMPQSLPDMPSVSAMLGAQFLPLVPPLSLGASQMPGGEAGAALPLGGPGSGVHPPDMQQFLNARLPKPEPANDGATNLTGMLDGVAVHSATNLLAAVSREPAYMPKYDAPMYPEVGSTVHVENNGLYATQDGHGPVPDQAAHGEQAADAGMDGHPVGVPGVPDVPGVPGVPGVPMPDVKAEDSMQE